MHRPLACLVLWLSLAPGVAAAADFEDSVPVESGGRLRIELDAGSIDIETHAEETVRVDARASGIGAGSMDFELRVNGNEVRLTGSLGGWLGGVIGGGPRVRVRVRVPEELDVDARTSGGSISVEDLQGEIHARTSGGRLEAYRIEGSVQLETSGGEVNVSRVEGDVVARTSGGRIRVSDVEGELDVRTSGGSIDIRRVAGRVDARTSGGSISVRFAEHPEGHVETSGGQIQVEFPRDEGAELDAQTSGGRVEIERGIAVGAGRVETGRVGAPLNGGGDALFLRTSGGNIRVRTR